MNIPINRILDGVCDYYGLTVEDLKSESKTKEKVIARQMYFYLADEFSNANFRQIGELINRDHSTVMYAANKIRVHKEIYRHVKKDIDEIIPRIIDLPIVVQDINLLKIAEINTNLGTMF